MAGPIAIGGYEQPRSPHGPRIGSTPNVAKPTPGLRSLSHNEGTRARLSAIRGETPSDVLVGPLWLPAIIAPLSFTGDATFTDYQTVGAGEFSYPAGGGRNAPNLRTFDSLNTMTLAWDAPWLIEHGLDDEAVESELWKILDSKRPVELLLMTVTISDSRREFRGDVTFRSMQREIRPSEPDARYFTIQIKGHRDPSVQRRGGGEGRKSGVKLPTTKRLLDTDTLASLSMEFYGTYSFWRLIRDANGMSHRFGSHTVIVYNTRFQTGQKIKIPRKPKSHRGK